MVRFDQLDAPNSQASLYFVSQSAQRTKQKHHSIPSSAWRLVKCKAYTCRALPTALTCWVDPWPPKNQASQSHPPFYSCNPSPQSITSLWGHKPWVDLQSQCLHKKSQAFNRTLAFRLSMVHQIEWILIVREQKRKEKGRKSFNLVPYWTESNKKTFWAQGCTYSCWVYPECRLSVWVYVLNTTFCSGKQSNTVACLHHSCLVYVMINSKLQIHSLGLWARLVGALLQGHVLT